MALVTKYYTGFVDYFGDTWRVNFQIDSFYSITPIYLMGGKTPLVFASEGSSLDPFIPIREKQARIQVVFNSFQEYRDFYALDVTTYCKIYKNNVLVFWGKTLPAEYTEPLVGVAHYMEITAVSGLSPLKTQYPTFTHAAPVLQYGASSLMTLLLACFNKIGYNIPILDGSMFYETSMDESKSALLQTYVLWGSLRDGTRYVSYYDILERICRITGSRILQIYHEDTGLAWLLQPIESLKLSPYTVKRLNLTTGAVIGTVDINNFVNITNKDGSPLNVITDTSGNVEIEQSPAELKIKSDIGFTTDMFIDNHDYAVFGPVVTLNADDDQLIIQPCPATLNDPTYGVHFYLGRANWANFNVTLRFKATANSKFYATLVLYDDNAGTSHFYDNDGDWQNCDSHIIAPFYTHVPSTYVSGEIVYDEDIEIPHDYALLKGVLVLILKCQNYNAYTGPAYLDLSSLSMDASHVDGQYVRVLSDKNWVERFVLEQDIKNTYAHGVGEKEIPVPYSDALKNMRNRGDQKVTKFLNDNYFTTNSFVNMLFIHDGSRFKLAENWYRAGNSSIMGYSELVLSSYDQIYYKNTLLLSCDILGRFDLDAILVFQEEYAMSINSWELDVHSGIHHVELSEVGKNENLLITDSGQYLITESDSNYIDIDL